MQVTDETVELGCKAIADQRGYVWPDEFSDDEKKIGRENMRAALTAALSDKQAGEVKAQDIIDRSHTIVDDVLDMALYLRDCPRENIWKYQDAANRLAAFMNEVRSALVDVPAVESEPVAWTSPGQLREIERGANGIVTKYGDEFMSVPLYSDPPRSLSNEGETERTLGELLQLLVAESGAAYCQSLRQFEQIPCLGWERKAKDGAYGEAEHAAHRKANELMGQHQGLARAVKILRDALSALAATRSGSATTASGGHHAGEN